MKPNDQAFPIVNLGNFVDDFFSIGGFSTLLPLITSKTMGLTDIIQNII